MSFPSPQSASLLGGGGSASRKRPSGAGVHMRLPPIEEGASGQQHKPHPPRPGGSAGTARRASSISGVSNASNAMHLSGGGGGGRASAGGARRSAVWVRLLRQRAQGRELLREEGDVVAGMRELAKALTQQAAAPGGLLEPVGATSKGTVAPGVPPVEPAWFCAEELVLEANRAAVQGSTTAQSLDVVARWFKEALKYVYVEGTDNELDGDSLGILAASPLEVGGITSASDVVPGLAGTGTGSRPQSGRRRTAKGGSTRAAAASSSSSSRRPGPDYFRAFPELKQLLCGLILNNIAVHMRAVGNPLTEVLQLLMRALTRTKGVLSAPIIYNIAVTQAALGRSGEAALTAQRCAALCAAYLRIDPTSEAETAAQAAERASAYTSFVVATASYMIASLHLLASLAAHGQQGGGAEADGGPSAEVQYCEQAGTCAGVFLPAAHPLHRRCEKRLSAAEARAASAALASSSYPATQADDAAPLQLPLMAMQVAYPFSQSPMLSTEAAEVEEADDDATGGAATAAAATIGSAGRSERRTTVTVTVAAPPEANEAIPISRVLRLWGKVRVPAKVGVLLKRAAKFAAKPAAPTKGGPGSRPSSAASARRASTASVSGARGGSAARPSSGSSKGGSRRSLSRGSGARPASPGGDASETLAPTPPPPRLAETVPANLVVTGIPRPAFNRYKRLTGATLHLLDSAAEGAVATDDDASPPHPHQQQQRLSTHPGAGGGVDDASDAVPGRRRRTSITYYTEAAAPIPVLPPLVATPPADGGAASETDAGSSTAAPDPARLKLLPPPDHMRTMDAELLCYSRLVVDRMPEIRYAAARTIQCMFRSRVARDERRRRAAAVEWSRERDEAAHVILRAYRDYVDCRPAKAERRRRDEHRKLVARLVLLQRYLYQKQSVEVWGHLCVAAQEKLLAELRQRRLEETSAITMQAWWRMTAAQCRYRRQRAAAIVVSRAWRCFAAKRELVRLRVLAKIAREEYMRAHWRDIVYVQRWYRACKARQAVAGLLESKQAAVAAYLDAEADECRAVVEKYGGSIVPLGEALVRVLATLHGAQARVEMTRRYLAMKCMRRAVTRWLLRTRGAEEIAQLRAERDHNRAVQRRREEVLDAVTTLQSAVRRWLPRHRAAIEAQAQQLLHRSATTIQVAYRAHWRRMHPPEEPRVYTMRELLRCPEALKPERMAQLRELSATKIQSIFRMYQARRDNGMYLQFMLVDRHQLARVIQKGWKRLRARRAVERWRDAVHARHREIQKESFFRVAVVRAQATVRMFLARCRVEKMLSTAAAQRGASAPPLWITKYQRSAAARSIQTLWRGYAARQYTHQLRLASAHYADAQTAREAQHAYATMIQKVVRGKLLNRRKAALALEQQQQQQQQQQPTRRLVGRRVVIRPATARECAASGSGERKQGRPATAPSALRLVIRSRQMLEATAADPGDANAATVAERHVATGDVSLTRPTTAVMEQQQPSASPSEQIATASAAAYVAADDATEEQQRAATLIQKIWRGYSVRCVYEYYYEEYEEIVSTSAGSAPNPWVPAGHSATTTGSPTTGGSVEVVRRHTNVPVDDDDDDEEDEEDDDEIDRTEQEPYKTLIPPTIAQPYTSFSLVSGQTGQAVLASTTGSAAVPAAEVSTMEQTVEGVCGDCGGEKQVTATTTTTTTTIVKTTTTTTTTPAGEGSKREEGAVQAPVIGTEEEHRAATLIQKIWRGHHVRSTYEYYYEEYEEEASVSAEEPSNDT